MEWLKTLFKMKPQKLSLTTAEVEKQFKDWDKKGLIFGCVGGSRKIYLGNGRIEQLLFIVDEYKFAFSNGKFGLFWKCKNLKTDTENRLENFLEKNNINVDFHQYVGDNYTIENTINLK